MSSVENLQCLSEFCQKLLVSAGKLQLFSPPTCRCAAVCSATRVGSLARIRRQSVSIARQGVAACNDARPTATAIALSVHLPWRSSPTQAAIQRQADRWPFIAVAPATRGRHSVVCAAVSSVLDWRAPAGENHVPCLAFCRRSRETAASGSWFVTPGTDDINCHRASQKSPTSSTRIRQWPKREARHQVQETNGYSLIIGLADPKVSINFCTRFSDRWCKTTERISVLA